MRLNIIKEEILRQWQKGYIKMLLVVILVISILTGYIHVYRVKESYNNIMNITRVTNGINYELLEKDIKEYKEYKQGIIKENAINSYIYIYTMSRTILVVIGLYAVTIALYDIKNKEIIKKMKKYGHLNIHFSKMLSIIIIMIVSIVIGIIGYLITIGVFKNIYNIMGLNLNIIGVSEKSITSILYNVNYVQQLISLIGIISLYVYIVYTFCLLIPYDTIMYLLTFITLGTVRKSIRTNNGNAYI